MKELGKDSLEDYEEIQERVRKAHGGDQIADESLSKKGGYCQREFQRWLDEVDPTNEWGKLSRKVNSTGDVLFVCQECF